MKKIFIALILTLFISTLVFAETWKINSENVGNTVNLEKLLTSRFGEVEDDIAALGATSNIGTGNIFYVDSGVGSDTYDGTKPEWAKATLDAAVGLCTANNGDVIYVMQGHNEAWTTTDSADLDVAGITVIGLGVGADIPTFDFDDTDGELVIGAASIRIVNLAFLPSVTGVVHAIEIEADADGSIIEGCWFKNGETSGTDEFIDAIQPAALADNITIKNCRFESWGGAGANTGIDLTAGVNLDLVITGNYANGDYAEAPIYSDNDAHLRMLVANNITENTNSGEYGIEFGGNATGVIANNLIYTDAVATALDPGQAYAFGNLCINTYDLSAIPVPAAPALSAQTKTAGSAEDILAKMYYTSDGTGAYPATVANDSTIAKIIAKGSTATASTFDNTTDSLEAISDSIALQERCISKTVSTLANGANNLFAVTGGPIKITEIVAYVTTTAIAAESVKLNYNIDPTTPATDTAFGTDGDPVELNGDAVGTLITWDGVLATDLLETTNGAALAMGTDVSYGLIVPIGMIEATITHDGAATGELTFYMTYVPLSSLSVVTAQ